MSRSNRLLWTVVLFAYMALAGAALLVRGPVVTELEGAFGAPAWQLGLIAPAGTAGYLVVISAVGFGAGHLEPHRLLLAGLLGSAVAMAAMGAAPLLAVFLVAVLVRGTMNGVMRGLGRPLISHFYPDRRGRVYSYFDMVWALGALLGPVLFVAAVLAADWRVTYYALAAGMLALAAVVWRLDAPRVESEEAAFDRSDAAQLLRRPEVLALVLAMFFGTGVEGGLFLWLPTYVLDVFPEGIAGVDLPTTALSALALSLMFVGYVPGRFLYGRLAERIGYLRLLVAILVLLVPAFAYTFVYAAGPWILAGVVAIGALISGIFPLLLSYATDAMPHHSGPVTALAAISSSLGVGITPAVMGWVISGSDAAAAMQLLLVPLVLALLIVLVARVAERKRDRAAPATSD